MSSILAEPGGDAVFIIGRDTVGRQGVTGLHCHFLEGTNETWYKLIQNYYLHLHCISVCLLWPRPLPACWQRKGQSRLGARML